MSIIDLHLLYYLQSHQHEYDLYLSDIFENCYNMIGMVAIAMMNCAILKRTDKILKKLEVA
jgi:DMSO/TMAO reductase YedYZ heme-binding membrane subunit